MKINYIKTKRLNVAYFDEGPRGGSSVLLLHGFPDDATSWSEVIKRLSAEGSRVIAPFIRGCGETAFLKSKTPRAGDFAALGQDAIEIVDALDLRDLVVAGQDWGSPTAEIVAVSRPERVKKLVKLNWYGIYTMAEMAKAQSFNYEQLNVLWYVWMLNTPMGEAVVGYDRVGFAKRLWSEWSPTWDKKERDKALRKASRSFQNEDWPRVALSAYRTGISDAESDPADEELRSILKDPPPVQCPVTIINGKDDGVEKTPLDRKAIAKYFPAKARINSLEGVGHFPQREAPEAVVKAISG